MADDAKRADGGRGVFGLVDPGQDPAWLAVEDADAEVGRLLRVGFREADGALVVVLSTSTGDLIVTETLVGSMRRLTGPFEPSSPVPPLSETGEQE